MPQTNDPFIFECSDEAIGMVCALDCTEGMTITVPVEKMPVINVTEIRSLLVNDAPIIIRSSAWTCSGRVSKVRTEKGRLVALIFPTSDLAMRAG